jgi:hypothetical protein
MSKRSSDSDETVISHPYSTAEDAIRAIQGLKGVGIPDSQIRVASSDADSAVTVAETTGAHVDTWVDTPDDGRGSVIVSVAAGEETDVARKVMHDGLVIGGADISRYEHTLVDSSVGSGAAVATSSGTGTGMTPGGGYEPNTGSSVTSSSGTLGQFAPGADTPEEEDDFPG